MDTKTCSTCGMAKPLDQFAQRKDRPDGRGSTCKQCKAEYDRQYRQANKDKVNEKNRRWWATNPQKAEEIKQRRRPGQREHWASHREQMLEANRQYHHDHPEQTRERKRRWYAENPDKGRAQSKRRRDQKREARQVHGRHTEQEWQYLLARHHGRCALCGSTDRITKDHIIPLSKGGTDLIDNIQPLCFSCNSRKADSLPLTGPN